MNIFFIIAAACSCMDCLTPTFFRIVFQRFFFPIRNDYTKFILLIHICKEYTYCKIEVSSVSYLCI